MNTTAAIRPIFHAPQKNLNHNAQAAEELIRY